MKCNICGEVYGSAKDLAIHKSLIHTKSLARAAKSNLDRVKDLHKFDLIKMVYESYTKGEFGDDGEVVAPAILSLIGGLVTDNFEKVRKSLSTLRAEKVFSKIDFSRLEKFE